jgi:bifunctional non-homologous end joining protein LigD
LSEDFVMLCDKVDKPFNSSRHLFEPKLNGLRIVRKQVNGKVTLYSRTGRDITVAFPDLVAPSEFNHLIDGEAVVMGEDGVPCFNYAQQRFGVQDTFKAKMRAKQYPAQYWAFDMLSNGGNLEPYPLLTRKQALAKWDLPKNCHLNPYVVGEGVALFNKLTPQGWEGTVAKELDSPYIRRRSRLWIKAKAFKEGKFVVVGVTRGQGNREGGIGALLLAEVKGNDLIYVGEVGTGLTFEDLAELQKRLIRTEHSHLANHTKVDDLWYWTMPTIRAEVAYFEKTGTGKLFHPAVKRLKYDHKK